MSDQPKPLLEKMLEIYKSIDFIPKLGSNSKQNYKFMRHADVSRELRKQLIAQRVYVEVNYTFASDVYTVARANGHAMAAANARCTLVFHDLDSKETLTASGLGSGADTGDKHVYKAMTGALKYALKNAFLVPDEADAEADERTDEGTQNNIPDDMPDFREAAHAEAKPAPQRAHESKKAADKAKGEPVKKDPTPAPATSAVPPKAEIPSELLKSSSVSENTSDTSKNSKPATVTPSTTEGTPSKSATSTTLREPGEDGAEDNAMPNETDLDVYRKAFQKLGDDLSTEGGLKSSPKLPIERKLLVFLLSITKAGSPKEITNTQWKNFFARVEAAKAAESVGIKGITMLVNRASGIEPKEKK